MIFHYSLILVLAVIIHNNCTTAEVHMLAYLCITNIGQMGNFRSVADGRFLDLHKISNLHFFAYDRIRSDISERSYCGFLPHF
jgi:hypothetical protein